MSESPISNYRFIKNVAIKTIGLFVLTNLLFASGEPILTLERISAYNALFPGRVRLPFGEIPEKAYNLSLFQMGAMFAAHELDASYNQPEEYRVILLGDSSVWGFLLEPHQTLQAALNGFGLTTPIGKRLRFYNLGYPTLSLTKDLLILEKAMQYKPDMIVWLVTLESFPSDKQLASPLVQHNPGSVRRLVESFGLEADINDPQLVSLSNWERTIIGRRRALADLIRLQLYGALWSGTGIDQYYPPSFDPPQEDLSSEDSFHGLTPPHFEHSQLAFNALETGYKLAGNNPVLIVNEPVYLSQGKNSDIRYNFFYPRWAYDQYRMMLLEMSRANHWNYVDAWDLVPPSEFTNSAIHLTPEGTRLLAWEIRKAILTVLQ